MTNQEHALIRELRQRWRRQQSTPMWSSKKTEPLPDVCRDAIRRLAQRYGITVEFIVEPLFNDPARQQHFIRAHRIPARTTS